MRGALRFLANLFWAIGGLFLLLIIGYFVLRVVRRHTPAPISSLAGAVESALQP
jgi:hypothetical protein